MLVKLNQNAEIRSYGFFPTLKSILFCKRILFFRRSAGHGMMNMRFTHSDLESIHCHKNDSNNNNQKIYNQRKLLAIQRLRSRTYERYVELVKKDETKKLRDLDQ